MDFIFGTLSTDELKLYRHRLLRRGIHHGHRIEPQLPKLHEPITLTVTTGSQINAQSVACYYTTDGSTPEGSCGEAAVGQVLNFAPVETAWDTLIWGYVTRWEATLPPLKSDALLRYRISAWGSNQESADQEEVFADYPHEKHSLETAAVRHFRQGQAPDMDAQVGDPARGTTFALNVPALPIPAWVRDAIIYHIFVDRFYPGNDNEWTDATDLMDIHGGTLQGVIDKLDYVKALGVNTIWLSPIFESPSHHGYDATNFRKIEPRLGDEEIFKRLVDRAHERDLRVIVDLACNHCSNEHPYFVDALNNSSSSYRNWFTFDSSEIGYRTFLGVHSLPEINLDNPDAREWMLENARYWIREFGIDGYRLDHANGPGPDFWSDFNRACKAEDPACFCFGEIIDTPDILQSYVGRLDGLLDFQINEGLRKTFGWQTGSIRGFEQFLSTHTKFYPANFACPAFIDNHDMNRFSYIAPNNKQALLDALSALMQLPNPPVIYYGTELGLSQPDANGLHANRVRMLWGDDQNYQLLKDVQEIIQHRGL